MAFESLSIYDMEKWIKKLNRQTYDMSPGQAVMSENKIEDLQDEINRRLRNRR